MAESFAFGIADRVVGKLASVTVQELIQAWGFETQVEELRDTISTIRAVLLDAEEKQAKDHRLSIWLGKLKDVFYEAEDVVDAVEYEGLRQQAEGVREQVLNFFSRSNPVAFRLKISHRIKGIREKLRKVGAEKSQFNLAERFEDRPPAFHREREMTHSFVRASDVIGRERDRERIVNRLLKESTGGENVSVIPIVGIGGLGKTTLAKLVFNDGRVGAHFEKKLWVCVSQDFDVKRVTKEILTSATHDDEKCDQLSIDQLQNRIRNALDNVRFLLVLDDVWEMGREKWLELKALLMDGACGSKIMVTTRSKLVASNVGTSPDHELKGLSDSQCLSLLLKCAFRDGEAKRFPNLVKIGVDIVKKCGGVPLAVRTLGGLLYLKTEEHDWVSARDNEIWELEQRENDILPALKLSYDELSFSLKQCFAFCALFPKGFRFSNIELIQMWMAQGLIQSSEKNQHQQIEDIGNRYINELLVRCFFQDVEEEIRRVWYYFKMHDLVHDLALSVAQPECRVLNLNPWNENTSERIRHVSYFSTQWPTEEEGVVRNLGKLSDLRTISLPIIKVGMGSESFMASSISRFKRMRVLDLANSSFEVLPNSICDLKYLRYLSLSNNNKIKGLPDSISKLHHLLVLLLDGCLSLENLPRCIRKMMSLRHLEITTRESSVLHYPKGASRRCFNSLRLLCIRQCNYMDSLMEGMQEDLTALGTLVIADCYGRAPLPRHLTALTTLLICNCDNLDLRIWDGQFKESIHGFESLQVLGIWELPQLETLPQWLLHSQSLRHLLIHDCKTFRAFSEEEVMLNLTSLETLVIEECPEFSALPEGMRHLTALRRLDISYCRKLSALPEAMRRLPALTQLKIDRCNSKLFRRCQPRIGEDWDKIAHVLDIYLNGQKIESTFILIRHDFKQMPARRVQRTPFYDKRKENKVQLLDV